MSLINKMLQDLDARGSQAGSNLQQDIKPVAYPERSVARRSLLLGLAAGGLFAAGAVGAWLLFKRPQVAPIAAAPAVTVVRVPVVSQPLAQPAPIQVAQRLPDPVPEKAGFATPGKSAPAPASDEQFGQPAPREVRVRVLPDPTMQRAPVVAAEPVSDAPSGVVRSVSGSNVLPVIVAGGRDMNNVQRAESEYRRALNSLQDGRVSDAIRFLEQALGLNPRHEAGRQSLVGLLIEAGRNDEAMRQLEAGLALDPHQPALAMLLARMQIEGGGSGVATLQRSLASAKGSPDYLGFLAGALQRENRHREAVQQYQGALQSAPENGIWWMGLGISLQAEKRVPEAIDAFRRANASASLNEELKGFVERKLQQLGG
jgi:MSHA biogenesis protein MshN